MTNNEELDQSNFAWVAARAACTLPTVYASLRTDVDQDISTRNAIRPKNAAYEFLIEEKANQFSVVLAAKDFSRSVTFQLEDHAILVLDHSGNQMFEVTLNFNDMGKCRMKAKEENREPWQVRRMALEDLLFRLV